MAQATKPGNSTSNASALGFEAHYAWVQHFFHHLAPTDIAGFVLANGSTYSNQSGESEACAIALTAFSLPA